MINERTNQQSGSSGADALQERLLRDVMQAEHEIRTVALVEWGWPSGPRHDALLRWAGVLREAAARLGRIDPQEGWRDIATAPKDGTAVVVRFRNDIHEPEVARFIDGYWRTSDTAALWTPHFWMPLPSPPVSPSSDQTPTKEGA
jgi:hypothetical protein